MGTRKVVPPYSRPLVPPPAEQMAGEYIALICVIAVLVVALVLLAKAASAYGWEGDKGKASFTGQLWA